MPSSTFVYITTNADRDYHVGFTKDVEVELSLLSSPCARGRAARKAIKTLVYVERSPTLKDALTRVDQIRKMRRTRKERLVAAVNPKWRDLAPWLDYLIAPADTSTDTGPDDPPMGAGIFALLPVGPPPRGYSFEQLWPRVED